MNFTFFEEIFQARFVKRTDLRPASSKLLGIVSELVYASKVYKKQVPSVLRAKATLSCTA
jgi:hypothetical protein